MHVPVQLFNDELASLLALFPYELFKLKRIVFFQIRSCSCIVVLDCREQCACMHENKKIKRNQGWGERDHAKPDAASISYPPTRGVSSPAWASSRRGGSLRGRQTAWTLLPPSSSSVFLFSAVLSALLGPSVLASVYFFCAAVVFAFFASSLYFFLSVVSMSSVMRSKSNFGFHPQSLRAMLSSSERGQVSAIDWR